MQSHPSTSALRDNQWRSPWRKRLKSQQRRVNKLAAAVNQPRKQVSFARTCFSWTWASANRTTISIMPHLHRPVKHRIAFQRDRLAACLSETSRRIRRWNPICHSSEYKCLPSAAVTSFLKQIRIRSWLGVEQAIKRIQRKCTQEGHFSNYQTILETGMAWIMIHRWAIS